MSSDPIDAPITRVSSPAPEPTLLDTPNHQSQDANTTRDNPVNAQENGYERPEDMSNGVGSGSVAGIESPILSPQGPDNPGEGPNTPPSPHIVSQQVLPLPTPPQLAPQYHVKPSSVEAASDRPHSRRERERSYTASAPPNPYSGMGLYMTPQLYSSPLPLPGLDFNATPLPDNSYIYAKPKPRFGHQPQLPQPQLQALSPYSMPIIPHAPLQPTSTNVVAAAAASMTPEMRSNPLARGGSFANTSPYWSHGTSRHEKSTADLHHRGTFAESNPYHFSPHSRRPTLDSQPHYPEWKPLSNEPHDYPRWTAPSSWSPSGQPNDPRRKSMPSLSNASGGWAQWNEARGGSQIPGQGLPSTFQPSTFQPFIPPPLPAASGQGRQHTYDTFPVQIQHVGPVFPERTPRRQMTATDVVSAAVNAPPPEKRQVESLQAQEPYASPSAHRQDTLSGERVPTHLSTTPRWDTSLPQPSGWGVYNGPSQTHRRRRRRSESYSDSSDSDSDDVEYRHSARPTPPPGYPPRSRKRRGRRSYSPFKYPEPPVVIPYYPPQLAAPAYVNYTTPAYKGGFWKRLGTFFKSPFDRGRPTAFKASDQRTIDTDKPTGVFFFLEVIVGQIYFHVLLRLPSLYFSRVSRIFDEANLNLFEIAEMVFETAGTPDSKEKPHVDLNLQVSQQVAPKIRPQYERLKSSWEAFIDALIREWETFNIVSVMLLTAILTILQINTAASDPVTRYSALFSLICALLSLLYGCMYIIRFGTMRKTYAAAEWAKAALRTSRSDVWNVWVLLSMPVVWLAWSLILFIVAIMSFVWRTTADNDNPSSLILSTKAVLIIRIIMSCVLGLGMVNTVLITNTFRYYGEALDQDWKIWIEEWQKLKNIETRYESPLDGGNIALQGLMPYLVSEPPPMQPRAFGLPSPSRPWVNPPVSSPNTQSVVQAGSHHPPAAPEWTPDWAGWETHRQQQQQIQDAMKDPNLSEGIWLPKYFGAAANVPRVPSSTSSSSSESTSPPPRKSRRKKSSRYYSKSARRRRTDGSLPVEAPHTGLPSVLSDRAPHADRPEGGSSPRRSNLVHEADATDNRVRFRSPLASAQDSSTVGGSDWGAYDSPQVNSAVPRVVAPSSSSASAGGMSGVTPEASNVEIQRGTDALRQRRRSTRAS